MIVIAGLRELAFLMGPVFLGLVIVHRLQPMLETRPHTGRALLDFAHKSRRFPAITTVFAMIVGVADTLLLPWLEVPLAPP